MKHAKALAPVALVVVLAMGTVACLPQPAKRWPWERTQVQACRVLVPDYHHDRLGWIFHAFVTPDPGRWRGADRVVQNSSLGRYFVYRWKGPYKVRVGWEKHEGWVIWNHARCMNAATRH